MISRVVMGLVAAVALCSAPSLVAAKVGSFTGDDYLHRCTKHNPDWKPGNNDEQEDAIFCLGYVEAAVTLIVWTDQTIVCLPNGVTPQDMLKATFTYLRAHPNQIEYLLPNTMVAGVRDRWPRGSKWRQRSY